MIPRDTSITAAAVQEQVQREIGIGGRLRAALELSDLTHAFAIAGIRDRHPEYSEEDARRELAALLYGFNK